MNQPPFWWAVSFFPCYLCLYRASSNTPQKSVLADINQLTKTWELCWNTDNISETCTEVLQKQSGKCYEFSAFGLTGSCPPASTTALKSIRRFPVMLQPRIIDSKSVGLSGVCLRASAWLRLMLTKVPGKTPTLTTHTATAHKLPPQGMLDQLVCFFLMQVFSLQPEY